MADTIKYKFIRDLVIDGKGGRSSVEGTADSKAEANPAAGVPVAKAGALTTRGSNTAGTLTMGNSHGIQTGDRLDIYWTESGVQKHRRGVTVGSVSGTSVPFTGGAGDNLPALVGGTYPITASVPDSEAFNMIGDQLTVLRIKSDAVGLVVITQSDNTEIVKYLMDGTNMQTWLSSDGTTNPLTGVTAAKVFFSQAETSGVAEMSAIGLRN